MNRTERSIKMILTKENGTGKNAVVGGSDYTRFIAIAPSSAEDMRCQMKEAAALGEAGIEIQVGNLANISDALVVLKECKDDMAGQAVILNLDTTGCDASASDDEKIAGGRRSRKGRYR